MQYIKTEIYTWRVASDVKSALEAEARLEKISVAALLDQLTRDWLRARSARSADDSAGQARLHAAASKFIGKIEGKDPRRSESVRSAVRERLARKHAGRLSG